jgi:hypothetical protein
MAQVTVVRSDQGMRRDALKSRSLWWVFLGCANAMKVRSAQLGFLTAFVFALVGCGTSSNRAPSAPLAPPVDPATAASIIGTVKFEGAVPTLSPIDMSNAPACANANSSPVVPPVVETGRNGTLANVVVYVKSGLGRYRYPAPPNPAAILDQGHCMYRPRVLALMVGQPFEVANSDPILHDVQAMLRNNPRQNTSQLPGSPPFKFTFENPEFAAPVGCMIHPWMRAYLFVFDQPYFAVTAKDGIFTLKNLPPATYTIEAWHEGNQPLEQTVVLGQKEAKSISFTFRDPSTAG